MARLVSLLLAALAAGQDAGAGPNCQNAGAGPNEVQQECMALAQAGDRGARYAVLQCDALPECEFDAESESLKPGEKLEFVYRGSITVPKHLMVKECVPLQLELESAGCLSSRFSPRDGKWAGEVVDAKCPLPSFKAARWDELICDDILGPSESAKRSIEVVRKQFAKMRGEAEL
ncbi:hypothetical protein M885DRAFT_513284 [Pelagophyceae sp. CCMP2097]|nr:hypothetical protein M885DRAFT_513284 [Pelagophyceae sp. CCMP2097]